MPSPESFEKAYEQALARYVDDPGEATLQAAHDLGRRAISEQLSVLAIAETHMRVEAGRGADYLVALPFLLQALAPLDMATRGFLHGVLNGPATRRRRVAAARLSAELAATTEVDDVLAAAVIGFGEVFEGSTTLLLTATGDGAKPPASVITAEGGQAFTALDPDLQRDILAALAADGARSWQPATGLLIRPESATAAAIWIEYPTPRFISADELILADLLAETFATAMDRARRESARQHREEQFRRALESHERVGQAIGILIERHRLTPREAFATLVKASQEHQVKLRQIAESIIATGLEPEEAVRALRR